MALEKTLESPLDSKQIKPVHPKGDQSWVFIGGTDVEAETSILWPPDVKNWLIGKDPHAGKDWGQEEKGTTEDDMAGWHHRLNGNEFECHLFRLLYPWNISPWRSCTLFIWLNSVYSVDHCYEWHHRLCSIFSWQLLMLKNTIDFCEWILLYLAFLLNSLISSKPFCWFSWDSYLKKRKKQGEGKVEGRKEERKKG